MKTTARQCFNPLRGDYSILTCIPRLPMIRFLSFNPLHGDYSFLTMSNGNINSLLDDFYSPSRGLFDPDPTLPAYDFRSKSRWFAQNRIRLIESRATRKYRVKSCKNVLLYDPYLSFFAGESH